LIDIPGYFTLYGGTAIALRLAHRQSVDFDFFGAMPKCYRKPGTRSPAFRNARARSESRSLRSDSPEIGEPDVAPDVGLRIAVAKVDLDRLPILAVRRLRGNEATS
jgi:Nucleotidyl transferase AbiEii toxin, Type IV TA system